MNHNDFIAFNEATHASNLDNLFNNMDANFEIYMDERVHSDPNKPINAEQAGISDARQTPPEPDFESEKPADGSYISDLYTHAEFFFKKYMEICESHFNFVKSKLDKLMSADTWSENKFNTNQLEKAISNCNKEKEEFEIYIDKNKDKLGSRVLEPTQPSSVIFIALVFFVAVFEFVWVWYFLSEQLGLSAAIYVSMVATTLVIVIAALCAFSHANTAKDLIEHEQMRRSLGYGGIVFCILLFLFGIGLLSGWRADSTKEGIALLVEGYQSLTKIDVFVTAVINFAGFVFLTREFRRFFWPYPLFHYAQWKKKLEEKKVEVKNIEKELKNGLEDAKQKINKNRLEVVNLLSVMEQFQSRITNKIENVSSDLDRAVARYWGYYRTKNLVYRTKDVYPEPEWLKNEQCIFTVSIRGTTQKKEIMEKRFQSGYVKYVNKYEEYLQKITQDEEEIEKTYDKIADITKELI